MCNFILKNLRVLYLSNYKCLIISKILKFVLFVYIYFFRKGRIEKLYIWNIGSNKRFYGRL